MVKVYGPRDLDRRVAVEVMGIKVKNRASWYPKHYSTDMNHCMDVIKELNSKGFALSLLAGMESWYLVVASVSSTEQRLTGPSLLPETICNLALELLA